MIETDVTNLTRINASRAGWKLWRNNVGAGKVDGKFIRWGLCNETPAANKNFKSSDLIGIRPVLITPDMVGQTIGQFVSIETKAPGWRYHGTEREVAQKRWIDMILANGGLAFFTNDGVIR